MNIGNDPKMKELLSQFMLWIEWRMEIEACCFSDDKEEGSDSWT